MATQVRGRAVGMPFAGAAELRPAAVRGLRRALAVLERWGTALLMLLILESFAGTGGLVDATGPFDVQAQATVLHDRWVEMASEGVPSAQLAELESEFADASHPQLF